MEKISSNRSFGILFCIVFALIAVWPLMHNESLRFWAIPISMIFFILGLLNSKLLSPLNLIWIKFGELLGRIIAPIVMAIIYFIIVTPIGLFMRLIGKDLLKLKFLKNNSYWTKREKNIGSMKRQF
mgnify:CR=1 FL=1|tara:strand:+ start:1969 stop:2346 length:378 start_codon:yes stop_codon:yes gene_type:complete